MFIPFKELYLTCQRRIDTLEKQGHVINGLREKLGTIPDSYDAWFSFAHELIDVPMRDDFPYVEPNNLAAILQERPARREDMMMSFINEMEISDKVYGGVYGRMLGCILGKPFEMSLTLPDIRAYLEGAKAWPLTDFIPSVSQDQRQLRRDCIESTKGFVRFVQPDDDLNYMIIGLKVLEQIGLDFKTQDIALLWRDNIPYGWNWGPEHTRSSLLTGYWWDPESSLPDGDEWERLQAFLNDGEELIGAMIRGDTFGLVNPGRPAIAAEMAWRDGRLTHAKTGLYAEMWVAATIAAAFHTRDPFKAIQIGLDQLPQRSRYVECLREVLGWCYEEPDWYKVWERINEKWGYLGFNGTFNESAAVVNSITHCVDEYGNVDFEKAICTQVMQGWDCDSTGATAGCIAGVLAGYRCIPEKWLAPVQDTFYTTVATERETRISALAERMYQMSRIVRAGRKV